MARRTPIRHSLMEIKSTWGAEFLLTLMNVTLCFVMVMGPRFVWWPLVMWFIQKLLQWNFRRDPQMSLVVLRYIGEGDHYDPWPRATTKTKRPLGLGRDVPLC